jgi:hypothetical protein
MYIVISKPKRKSQACGVCHCMGGLLGGRQKKFQGSSGGGPRRLGILGILGIPGAPRTGPEQAPEA